MTKDGKNEQENPKPISRREFAMSSAAVLGAYTSLTQVEEPVPLSEAAKALKLDISDDVMLAMEERHIIDSDIRRVIEHAENTGLKLYESGTGRFLSKLRILQASFYVEYSVDNGVYKIHAAYTHRFSLEGDKNG
jgi:hypothetical protein